MADKKCGSTDLEEQITTSHEVLHSNQSPPACTVKNFLEDEQRNPIINKMREDLNDMKSEISDGRRIDLDEDVENYVDYHNKGKNLIKINSKILFKISTPFRKKRPSK